MQICPSCGEENPDRFRLCGFCGTPLVVAPPPQEVRKTVTIVFSDLKGSTELGERLDSEALREVLHAYFEAMKTVLERHGGTIEKYIGDAIMAVFGLNRVHEDDAVRAVRAAYEMQEELKKLNDHLAARWGVALQNRTGVNTGEVIAGQPAPGQRLVTGDAVNVAARLEQAAPPLETLIGEPTYRLVRDAVDVEPVEPLELKGKSERIPAYRLRGVSRREGVARRADTPLVGRSAELNAMVEALARVSSLGSPQMVTVLAPAGTGKSRLIQEFLERAADKARVLHGRCLSYGEGSFGPLAEMVRDAAGITDADDAEAARTKLDQLVGGEAPDVTERLAAVLGLGEATFPVRETFWATRQLIAALSHTGPVVARIEDIHWAELTFLDLLRYLAEPGSDAPALLLLCSARPELLDQQPGWGESRDGAQVLILSPLSEVESGEVVCNLLGDGTLAEAPRRRIIEAAAGNPLFVEQMLSMMIDDGLIRREGTGWVAAADLSSLAVPPSITALLAARLDRLGATDRSVLERGAVIGQLFLQPAVEALCSDELRPQAGASLDGLVRRELVTPVEAGSPGQRAFRFDHALIRDAAYQGLLKRTRVDLHERFADWLEANPSEHSGELDEVCGYHLEQACLTLAQLGPVDERGKTVGRRGATHLAAAGERARSSGDVPATATLLHRAATLDPHGREAPRWLLHIGEALGEMGQFQAAEEALITTEERARAQDRPAFAIVASVVRRMWRFLSAPENEPAAAVAAECEQAIRELERTGSHEGLARAWRLMAYVHFYEGQFSRAEEAVTQAIHEAELGSSRVFEIRMLSALASCVVYSATPVSDALDRCQEILGRGAGDRRTEAMTFSAMSHLQAMCGSAELARDLYQRSRKMLTELGFSLSAAITSLHSGPAEMLAGDLDRAESELRADYEALTAMGDKGYTPTVAGLLAEVLHAQGRDEEASTFAGVCHDLAAPHDVGAQYQWRCIQAKLLAVQGRPGEAEEMAHEAVRVIRTTDQPDVQGDALVGLAEVLEAAGKPGEAEAALAEAIPLFEKKGNTVSAARALRAMERLRGAGAIDRPQILRTTVRARGRAAVSAQS